MKKKFALYFSLILSLTFLNQADASICFVKADATGLNNGSSWTDAYTSLQSAVTNNSDTIWIAAGVYKPTVSADRLIAFNLRNTVFGGFAGTETLLAQRNIAVNHTILSGDIGIQNDTSDNSKTIIRLSTNFGQVNLFADGLILEKAANSAIVSFSLSGGTVYATFNNCRFRDNNGWNGAVLNAHSGGSLTFNNCVFEKNNAASSGGAIHLSSSQLGGIHSSAQINDCRFYNNFSSGQGGVIFLSAVGGSRINADRCVFAGNSAGWGGVVYNDLVSGGSLPQFTSFKASNSIFAGNRADSSGGIIHCSKTSVLNCTITGNKSPGGTGISTNANSVISNSIIWDNVDSAGNVGIQQLDLNTPGNTSNLIFKNIIQNNTTIPGNFDFDPLFIAPAPAGILPFNFEDYDYHLNILSPAVNLGSDSLITSAVDLDSNMRIQGLHVDLGCYEKTYCPSGITGNIIASTDTLFCSGTSSLLTAPVGAASYHWSNGALTDTTSIVAPGMYTVSLVDASNCLAQFSKQIIDYLPFISISGDTATCLASATLTAAGNVNTYLWNNGVTTPDNQLSTTGDYYVVGTNSQGCSITSDTIHVSFYAAPAQPVITLMGLTALATSTFSSYQWLKEEPEGSGTYVDIVGATGQYFTPAAGGSYKVRVASTQGCTSTSDPFAFIPLGLHDSEVAMQLNLYPNPVNDYLNITLEEQGPISYVIRNVVGKTVILGSLKHAGNSFSLSLPAHLVTGTYFLQLSTAQHNYQAKFIIQK